MANEIAGISLENNVYHDVTCFVILIYIYIKIYVITLIDGIFIAHLYPKHYYSLKI